MGFKEKVAPLNSSWKEIRKTFTYFFVLIFGVFYGISLGAGDFIVFFEMMSLVFFYVIIFPFMISLIVHRSYWKGTLISLGYLVLVSLIHTIIILINNIEAGMEMALIWFVAVFGLVFLSLISILFRAYYGIESEKKKYLILSIPFIILIIFSFFLV